VRCVGVIKHIN